MKFRPYYVEKTIEFILIYIKNRKTIYLKKILFENSN